MSPTFGSAAVSAWNWARLSIPFSGKKLQFVTIEDSISPSCHSGAGVGGRGEQAERDERRAADVSYERLLGKR